MKKLSWKKIYTFDRNSGEKKFVSYSLVEILPLDNAMLFWGSIIENGDNYKICVYDKERHLKTVNEKIESFKEATVAIEKFLFDNGIVEEGDEVEYYE